MLLYYMLTGTSLSGDLIFPWYFPLFWVVPLIFFLLAWIVLWRFAWGGRYRRGSFCSSRPLAGGYREILKRRLAEGDIDEEEYDRLLGKLGEGERLE